MASVAEALGIALDLLDAERLAEAETLCGRIIDADPDNAAAWRIAGVAAARTGRMETARDRFAAAVRHAPERVDSRLNHVAALAALALPQAGALRRALALEPAQGEVWSALADAAAREEGPAAAITPWRALAGLHPGLAAARYNLGVALQGAGRLNEAAAAYAAAIRVEPAMAEAHFNRANALRDLGRTDEAARAHRAALTAAPADPAAARNLGLLLLPADPAGAVGAFAIAARLEPDRAEARLDHAAALLAAARAGEALATFDAALARRPDLAVGHNGRALASRALGREAEAEFALMRALAADPAYAEAWTNRAQGLRDLGRLGAAGAAARRALRLRPDYPAALGVLARIRHDAGRPEEAAAILRRVLALAPRPPRDLHSDYLLVRQSDPAADAAALLAEHRRWAILHAPPLSAPPLSARSRPASPAQPGPPDRVTRIGYLSADLCAHSVASFFEPLLAAHDRRTVHIVCYAAGSRADAVTARLKALAGEWRDAAGLGDEALASLIRADRIDVLIDLGGHTGDGRLGVLALAPAPARLTALGYPGTTGLALEGRLTDPIIEPPGTEAWSSEPPIRLPQGFLCYRPPDGAPEPRSRRGDGPPIFGSFNTLSKLTDRVVATWAGVLADTPGARLMLKSRALGDASVAEDLCARFARHGIDPARLDLVAWTPDRAAHLALYDRIDVALDPFPYNGATTTCEAMWMGAPVVTLAGDRHAARVGAALLTRVGLTDLIAADAAAYRRIAAELAADAMRLADLRAGLRQRMRDGPLGDARGLAAAVEAACRALSRGAPP